MRHSLPSMKGAAGQGDLLLGNWMVGGCLQAMFILQRGGQSRCPFASDRPGFTTCDGCPRTGLTCTAGWLNDISHNPSLRPQSILQLQRPSPDDVKGEQLLTVYVLPKHYAAATREVHQDHIASSHIASSHIASPEMSQA